MARPHLVVDASVVVKWFSEEEYTSDALRLQASYASRRVVLHSPTLLPYELLNALRNNSKWTPEEIAAASHRLENLSIKYYPLQGTLAAEAVRVSHESNLSIYDASYLALGNDIDAVVYTADERMLAKVDNPRLRHIKDFTDPSA